MLLRKLVVVGLVGFVSLATNMAFADDAMVPNTSYAALDGVSFADQQDEFDGGRFDVAFNFGDERPRFTSLSPSPNRASQERRDDRAYELALTARATDNLDVSFAQRGAVGFNDAGDIARQSHGSELRLGRGLRSMRRERPSSTPTWYVFAASDDEALIWRPGSRNAFGGSSGGFALQDRVEIGDMQAGITYEVYGVQASLAYVQREISVRTGSRTFSQDEDFTGLTITMRH